MRTNDYPITVYEEVQALHDNPLLVRNMFNTAGTKLANAARAVDDLPHFEGDYYFKCESLTFTFYALPVAEHETINVIDLVNHPKALRYRSTPVELRSKADSEFTKEETSLLADTLVDALERVEDGALDWKNVPVATIIALEIFGHFEDDAGVLH